MAQSSFHLTPALQPDADSAGACRPASALAAARALCLALAAALAASACAPLPPAAAPGSGAMPTSQPAAADSPVRLRVMALNDFHGNLESFNLTLNLPDPAKPGASLRVPVGGVAALAGLVDHLRAGAPHSVVVSSGDMFGGSPLASTLFRHETTVAAMNRLGVDVAALGNHELDAGWVELQRVIAGGCAANTAGSAIQSCAIQPHAGARFTMLAANVETADGKALFAPTWVKAAGPVRVGFIGAVLRGTPSIVTPSGIAGLSFGDEADAINRSAAVLKTQGVHALVVTIHQGGSTGSADWNDPVCRDFSGPILDIARRITPDVALILSGHTHQGYRCLVDGRPIVQATSYGRGLSVVDLVIDPRTGLVDRSATQSRNLPVLNERTEAVQREALAAAESPPWGEALRHAALQPGLVQQVAQISGAVAPRARREVGRIGGHFDRSGRTDSSAGRLIADAQWAATRDGANGAAQFALMNSGGVRTDLRCQGLPPCTVTYGEAFSMQPFGNSLVVMTLSGAEIQALLEGQQPARREQPRFLQPSAALSYRWLASAPAGQRVKDLRLDGQPVRPEADYRVTVNSFLADGGDGFSPLRNGRQRLGGVLDLDALTAHLATNPTPVLQARIEWVD